MFFYTFITCTVTGGVLFVKDENGKGTSNDWPMTTITWQRRRMRIDDVRGKK